MSQKEVVLSVKKVKKNFLLPHEKSNSIKSSIVNIFKSKNRSIEVQHALKGVSFDIKKGEFFGILGKNGSGKSTLLKILAGIYQPTTGTVSHEGKLVPFIELGVGFNPELTGRENVYLNGALLGFSRAEIDARYDDIVKFAELEEFMDQKLKNYSSGMQVRLAFSVATRAEADILLIDEVLAVGDADFQRKCFDYFKSLKKLEKTVVFVTHDMGAVREYCERAILIQDGVIAHEGDASDIADEYLKLFNKSADDKEGDQQGKRWGNGQARIKKLDVKVANGEIKVTVDIKAGKVPVHDYVFGYRFINSEGDLIMGGNSLNAKNGKKLSLEANQTTRLVFTAPDILGSGTFSVGATVRLSDKITICDSWDDILQIQTTKEESYYPIITPATMEVE